MPADGLTKPLSKPSFDAFRKLIIQNVEEEEEVV
jgi:hypothetical protein